MHWQQEVELQTMWWSISSQITWPQMIKNSDLYLKKEMWIQRRKWYLRRFSVGDGKYKSLVWTGEWRSPTKDQKEILAIYDKTKNFTKANKGQNPKGTMTKILMGKYATKDLVAYNWCTNTKFQHWKRQKKVDLNTGKNRGSTRKTWSLRRHAIQEDDKSITCLLTLGLAHMWGIIMRGLLYQNLLQPDGLGNYYLCYLICQVYDNHAIAI